MDQNLNRLEKELRNFAKRCKDVKYTKGLLLSFLMSGAMLFGVSSSGKGELDSIKRAKSELGDSIADMKKLFRDAKKENTKLIKNSNLELIQLMEQGDQVVKSQWSTWQYGMGYTYDSWLGSYKGRGDKKKELQKILRNALENNYSRYFENNGINGGKYGLTELNLVKEPEAKITVSAGIRPRNVNKAEPTFVPQSPGGTFPGFQPKQIIVPGIPATITVAAPTIVTVPDPVYQAGGFGQGANIRLAPLDGGADHVFVENYETYKAQNYAPGSDSVKIDVTGHNVKISGGDIALTTTETGTTFNPSHQGTRTITPNGAGYNVTSGFSAFINDLRDRDSTYEGTFEMTNGGGGAVTKIFLSHNPAGVGETPGGTYDGTGLPAERKVTLKPNFKLRLHGLTDTLLASNPGKVLVGVEHQLWGVGNNNSNSFSHFYNEGEIELASGNNVIGVMIDTEYMNNTARKSHKTTNAGKIVINSKNSIGMDFGNYNNQLLKVDVTIGNIEVNGENNFGFRMHNVVTLNQDYFKYLTVTSGGSNKEITVKGKNNVGMSVAKNLKDSTNVNPIGNFKGINITVNGEETVGFLRNRNDPGINTNSMILDDDDIGAGTFGTMGKFTFGDDAKKSTLIRTDKYGIEIKKDITVANGDTSTGENVIGLANDTAALSTNVTKIINHATLTSTGQYKFRGLVSNGANSMVENRQTGTPGSPGYMLGSILISGEKDENIGMAALNSGVIKNSGTIKITGVGTNGEGKKRVGVYNDGVKATLEKGSIIEVHGGSSAAIYNKKLTEITGTTKITGKKGTIGIYSTGSGNKVEFNPLTTSDTLEINTDDTGIHESVAKGMAVYAGTGSEINIQKAKINVVDGASGIASVGTGSKVDLTDGVLKYSGDGYAVYTKNGGTADLSGTKVELRGNATGFEKDPAVPLPITMTTGTNGTKIKVFSNNVTVMNLINVNSLNLSGLAGTLTGYTGGVTPEAGTEGGVTFDKFKTAAIDGIVTEFKINADLDKSNGTATSDDYQYTRRLIVQRSKISVEGKNVKAVLNQTDLDNIGDTSVVGLAMSSSGNAISNAETGITLKASSTVKADRTDAGTGAVGLFINYGKVDVQNGASVNVEKESINAANDEAVGIYSVNGSEVLNSGEINVGGKKSIGILGLSYRLNNSGLPIENEFGTHALGQGKINVTNAGTLTLDGEQAAGIFIKNNNPSGLATDNFGKNTGTVNISGNKSIGMSVEKGVLENTGTINVTGQESTGIFGKSGSSLVNGAGGKINIAASASADNPNIGMFTDDINTGIVNTGEIIGGNNNYGIYGKNVTLNAGSKVKVGDNGVGIFSTGNSITLNAGSTIETGNNEAVGIFTSGTGPMNIVSEAAMTIGDGSYGYVLKSTGTTLDSRTVGVILGNKTVYIYSSDSSANITNRTAVTSTGRENYGIYSAGSVNNLADLNLSSGVGNVGIFSINGGTAVNGNNAGIRPVISVSGTDRTDLDNQLYGIGMAAGYLDKDTGNLITTGNIVNYGTINVGNEGGIGMYAVGSGSSAKNYGEINLSANGTVGMYLDKNAVGENYGTIRTVAGSTANGMIGVVLMNHAILKNYGQIIVEGAGNKGVYNDGGDYQSTGGTVTATRGASDVVVPADVSDTSKIIAGRRIEAPVGRPVRVYVNDREVNPIEINTARAMSNTLVTVGGTTLDLRTAGIADIPSSGKVLPGIGMYVDTSGVNFTNPIQGLENIRGLSSLSLVFGTEAGRYTNETEIKIGNNILSPYNRAIQSLVSAGGETEIKMNSASLTWMATGKQDPSDKTISEVYMVKLPYTAFAKEQDTYRFMDGLEQRYKMNALDSREKKLFLKLNDIGKGEPEVFAQAVDQMKGYQYANIQHRAYSTGLILDNEIGKLFKGWKNASKNSNKMMTFGTRGGYKTDTAGIIDYKSNAYGFAYVHENETVKLGHSSGWYAGAVHNRFKFKDIGGSKENQTMLKLGVFKTMSPAKDHNGSLQWAISGEGYVSRNDMHRKYLVVDEIFNAKSDYTTYGVALNNQLGYNIRTSERTSIRPYGGLKLEYGRFSNIKEKSGEMRLDIKGNDYYSVKPEVGVEFKYRQPMAVKTTFVTSLGVGYENELGQVGNVKNKAKVSYTEADWFNIRGEKDDRKGNFKADLNIGVENQRFGVTLNGGYDTKGKNARGGIGFRLIY